MSTSVTTENVGITISNHLLLNQQYTTGATGSYTRLLQALVLACKIIQRDVAKAGLVDVLGRAGFVNVQGEEVQKLDELANTTVKRRLSASGEVCALVSEEEADIIEIPRQYPQGSYLVHYDPLDGSSNIDANVSIGTIFSIYRRLTPPTTDVAHADVLQKGIEQAGAGYVIYGSSCILVFSTGQGVNGFTLDPSIGEFLLSHPNIKTPERGKIYSINEGNANYWDEPTKKYIDWIKTGYEEHRVHYTSRYIGSLVADFHRNLLYGGIFLYPADTKDPKKPQGKLRLMCEANPLAYIIEQAGGLATTGRERIMDIEPKHIHQRTPLIIGSPEDVRAYEQFVAGKRG
ncbi:MAG: class 1 fructose-bisphosphatase [Deltaproteobacteria bacterium]|jgi:fructose-1,6-bisphosphatase I|nr:class 1 fructose-bisphosphatase [Deltaproteobacteria bacterium]